MMWWLMLLWIHVAASKSEYIIGVGRADITGPSAGVGMMGYAEPSQVASGIHTRLYSRAFIIGDEDKLSVFVSLDCGMVSQILKMKVIDKLQVLYGDVFTANNVLLSGTHSHSGPGGYLQYLLFTFTNLGFIKESLDTMVDGVVASIEAANENLAPGYIYYNTGEVLDANFNRSPYSYEQNPAEERARYQHETDKDLHILKFTDLFDNPRGVLAWYPVHPVSMNKSNTLLSSDNVGLAALMLEEALNPSSIAGQGDIVAGFASSNLGDCSPNINGPQCPSDPEGGCNYQTSACNNDPSVLCEASGPGSNMYESTWMIASRLFNKSWELLFDVETLTPVEGSIDYIHQYVDMTDISLNVSISGNLETVTTCKPAMGYSFAAGTVDGAGFSAFKQNTLESTFFWNSVRNLIHAPSQEMIDCQAPKPILLPTGEMTLPQMWQPDIVSEQVLKIGNVLILGLPGEFTTMAGRRLRESFANTYDQFNTMEEDTKVILSGLSNVYADYVTTYEEYQVQRYEGGSTIYGPFTLDAFIKGFDGLAEALALGIAVDEGPAPPDMSSDQFSAVMPNIFDKPPMFNNYGDCTQQPYPLAYIGEIVQVKFVAGHPRNNPRRGDTFLTIERLSEETSTYEVIATDASWDTKFKWRRTSVLLGESEAIIEWDIPETTTPGFFRINYYGDHKTLTGEILPIHGISSVFEVASPPDHMISFWQKYPGKKEIGHSNRS